MLVYGDAERVESVAAKQADIEALLHQVVCLPGGVERHAALVAAFISASELVQGIADAGFEQRGCDARCRFHDLGLEWLMGFAHSIRRSWCSNFTEELTLGCLLTSLKTFDSLASVRTKRAEGYAFYALYPENYLEAAARSGLGSRTRIIGVRSIGEGLSAIVAAALEASPPVTVRPVGHPFYREVRLDPGTMAAWPSFRGQVFAVVDEGPGLSGSSFGAVADWLEANGTLREHIHFFPSHAGGLGPQASPSHRERWSGAARHSIDMDQLLVQPSGQRNLTAWVEEVLGPLDHPMEDLYGGVWRMRRYPTEEAWPAVNTQNERRKFLARAGGISWLVKFIGLDECSLQKVQRARNLHQAGFTPEIAGYRYGFLIERWHEDARPLDRAAFDRRQLVEHVGAYLGFRALHLPSKTGEGASLGLLRHMARHNTQQVLGQEAGDAIERRLSQCGQLENRARRVDTDNRMHLWKWLVLGDGLLKTDALDHSANHDLVGHQDVTWDIAGAIIELSLTRDETSRLCTIVEHESGHPVDREILEFLVPCYLAFQIGDHVLATHALGDGQETTRMRRRVDAYASLLRNVLEG